MRNTNYKILLFCVVTSLYWFSMYTYVPNLSTYAESLGASHKMVGLILGSYGFTQMLLRIPLGIFSDRINRRKIFINLGILISLISALAMGLFKKPIFLLIFRGLSGVAAAAWVTFTVLFSSYFPENEASKAIGYINSFNSLGQMAAMLLGGIIAQYLGPQSPFFLAFAVGVLAFILSFKIVEQKIDKIPIKISALLSVGKDKNLLVVSGLGILIQLLAFATVFGFTPIAAEKIGASEFELGLLSTLSTLPVIFASAMSGSVFAKRFGEKNSLMAGFLITSLSCIIIPFIKSLNLLYLSQMLGGFGRGLVMSLLMGLSIKTIEPDRRATAMGFFQAIYGIGMSIGPIMVGFLSDTVGLSWGFLTAGILGIVGALLSFLLIKSNIYKNQNYSE